MSQCPPASGAQAGSGGTGHRPAPQMANLPLSQPEPSMPNTALLIKNPLAATHEFKQACQLCYPKTGKVTPSYSTPLPRDAGNLRSVESQNDRIPVYQSEISMGRQKPHQLLRADRDVMWEAGTLKTAGKPRGVEAQRFHRAFGLLLHKLKPRSQGPPLSHRAQGAAGIAGQHHGHPTAQRLRKAGSSWLLRKHICRGKAACTSVHILSVHLLLGEFKPCLERRGQRSLGNVLPRLPALKSKGDCRSNSK